MPVPRLGPAPIPVTPDPVRKAGRVISHLLKLGYDLEDERDAVKIIENNNLDKSQFDFPYGSFEEFKKHTLDGEFDLDMSNCTLTPEQRRELDLKVERGLLWRWD